MELELGHDATLVAQAAQRRLRPVLLATRSLEAGEALRLLEQRPASGVEGPSAALVAAALSELPADFTRLCSGLRWQLQQALADRAIEAVANGAVGELTPPLVCAAVQKWASTGAISAGHAAVAAYEYQAESRLIAARRRVGIFFRTEEPGDHGALGFYPDAPLADHTPAWHCGSGAGWCWGQKSRLCPNGLCRTQFVSVTPHILKALWVLMRLAMRWGDEGRWVYKIDKTTKIDDLKITDVSCDAACQQAGVTGPAKFYAPRLEEYLFSSASRSATFGVPPAAYADTPCLFVRLADFSEYQRSYYRSPSPAWLAAFTPELLEKARVFAYPQII